MTMNVAMPRAGVRGLLVLVAAVLVLVAACAQGCAPGTEPADVPVRGAVDDYSWAELSALSEQIAAAQDGAERAVIEARYGLVNSEGELDGTQSKEVELADGTSTSAVIAGFCQDELAGGGIAGITFIFGDAVARHSMNNDAGSTDLADSTSVDAYGGWEASEARAWLNAEFVSLLPADLEVSLRTVDKRSTAVVAGDSGTNFNDDGVLVVPADSLIAKTQDRLWLPSCGELCDAASDIAFTDAGDAWGELYGQEGSQYQLFAAGGEDMRVRTTAGLDGACAWWLRSVHGTSFSEVGKDGAVNYAGESAPGSPQGMVPCFAL